MNRSKRHAGIRTYLLRSVCLFVLLPLIVIIIFLGGWTIVYLNRQTTTANETFVSQIAANADQTVETVNYATSMLMVNQELLNALRTVKNGAAGSYEQYLALRQIVRQIEYLQSSILNSVNCKLILLTPNNYMISFTDYGGADRDYTATGWYQRALENSHVPAFDPDIVEVFEENPGTRTTAVRYQNLYYARAVSSYSGEVLGVLLLQISSGKIWKNYLDEERIEGGVELYLMDADGCLQLSSTGRENPAPPDFPEFEALEAMKAGNMRSGYTPGGGTTIAPCG